MSTVTTISRFAGRSGLILKKHSPMILTVGGIVGGVAASVLGAKAALDSQPVVAKMESDLRTVKKHYDQFGDKELKKKAQIQVYANFGKEMIKLYAPAVGLGALSIASILWGHGIMRGRNAALTASLVTVERAFEKYREKVRIEFGETGESFDKSWAAGEEVVEDENGDPHLVVNKDYAHPYVHIFDELNPEWSKDSSYNHTYLRLKQNIWNDKLMTRGHVFLNEVLEDLGFPHTPNGAITGWLWSGEGDGYVDFGLNNQEDIKAAWREGKEPAIILEFNVDGVIYDRI